MFKDKSNKIYRRIEIYLIFVILFLSTILSLFNPDYLTLENLFDVLRSISFLGILAVGVLMVLISGGIDISFTATATVSQYIMALVIVNHSQLNIVIAFGIAIGIGFVLGAINACLIYYLKAPSIIITIATLNVYYSLLVFFSGGRWIYNFPKWFRNFARLNIFQLTTNEGIKIGFSFLTFIWLIIVVIAFIILKYTTLGRKIYAIGSNMEAAHRVGINIFSIQFFVYCFMGILAGVASVIQALLAQTVAPNAIMGRELDVIAAVVLGGASLFGGEGTLPGTLLGVALIAVMANGLTLMRVSSYWQKVAIGLIIIISVSINAYQRKMEKRRIVSVNLDE